MVCGGWVVVRPARSSTFYHQLSTNPIRRVGWGWGQGTEGRGARGARDGGLEGLAGGAGTVKRMGSYGAGESPPRASMSASSFFRPVAFLFRMYSVLPMKWTGMSPYWPATRWVLASSHVMPVREVRRSMRAGGTPMVVFRRQ